LCQGRLLRIAAVETIHTRYALSRPTGPADAPGLGVEIDEERIRSAAVDE